MLRNSAILPKRSAVAAIVPLGRPKDGAPAQEVRSVHVSAATMSPVHETSEDMELTGMASRRKKAATANGTKRTSEVGPFERVWRVVLAIPRGRVATYGQIAELIGRRLTPLGVSWALRAVPEGALPWHRVVNGSGGISTDREHPGVQRALLEAEGVRFDARGRVDLETVGWRPRVRRDAADDDGRAKDLRPKKRRRGTRRPPRAARRARAL